MEPGAGAGPGRGPLPGLDPLTPGQVAVATASIAVAGSLLVWHALAVLGQVDLVPWHVLVALLAGILAADFLSGLIHWSADTWGRDDLPVIGRRLLVPFRVHHVNPDDFLTRRFVDTNGDVALLAIPVLVAARLAPLDSPAGQWTAVALLGFSGVGMMTNQIHQWAHRPSVAWPIALLQRGGLLLGHRAHRLHHQSPYDARYCIATGWCNPLLDHMGFFRRLERLVTRMTGIEPRHDEARYVRALVWADARSPTTRDERG